MLTEQKILNGIELRGKRSICIPSPPPVAGSYLHIAANQNRPTLPRELFKFAFDGGLQPIRPALTGVPLCGFLPVASVMLKWLSDKWIQPMDFRICGKPRARQRQLLKGTNSNKKDELFFLGSLN